MKKFLLLAALACGSLSAMADVTVTLRGCVQDGKGNFDVMFNDTEADAKGKTSRRDIQFEIVMPKGLTIVPQEEGREEVDFLADTSTKTGALNGHGIGSNFIDGAYRLVINTTSGKVLYNGRLCSFKVTADATKFTKEDFEVKNIIVTTDENGESVKPADVNAFAVPVKITNTVATIVSPYEIALPTGVMAEEGTDDNSVVTVDEDKATTTLVAGVPSFIFGAEVDATYYGVQSVEKPSKGNVLTGTFADQKISSGYVLQGDKLRNVNVEVTLPAYKAYIAEGVGVKEFSLNGVTTGITVNEAINGEQVIYNVAGQRLNKTQKGVNIVNGKKYIVK